MGIQETAIDYQLWPVIHLSIANLFDLVLAILLFYNCLLYFNYRTFSNSVLLEVVKGFLTEVLIAVVKT